MLLTLGKPIRRSPAVATAAAAAVLGPRAGAAVAAHPVATTASATIALARPFTCGPVSAASNARWKARQAKDPYAREAKVRGLKSRAAFKLLEMDAKYRLFQPGQTVVDLGYAPGSWSQVAVERTKPHGQVVGIDLIPAQPPRGVSTIQGNFLAPSVRALVKAFLAEQAAAAAARNNSGAPVVDTTTTTTTETPTLPPGGVLDRPSYLTMERQQTASTVPLADENDDGAPAEGQLVDVVLSDMSAPWPQTHGFWLNTLSRPYKSASALFSASSSETSSSRMMNTSGTPFRDHAGSMDLCMAALAFACDTLRPGGHFVCKFYQGNEERALEQRLRRLFVRVSREKPESSRKESKEAYFVALKRKRDVTWQDVEGVNVSNF